MLVKNRLKLSFCHDLLCYAYRYGDLIIQISKNNFIMLIIFVLINKRHTLKLRIFDSLN